MAPTSPWKPSALLAVSGSLLYLLTKGPPSLQDKLLQYLPASISIEKVTKYVKWLFILSAAGQVNSLLSAWAHNNWLLHEPGEKFGANGWDKEVVVITGGSMGIGKETIRRLQAKGMKVANLDITEPTEECKLEPPTEVALRYT
jgi:all-trans-retinol dehydrogenase (NAD+)